MIFESSVTGAPKLRKKGACALTYRPYGRAPTVQCSHLHLCARHVLGAGLGAAGRRQDVSGAERHQLQCGHYGM